MDVQQQDQFNPDKELRELFHKFAKNGLILKEIGFEYMVQGSCAVLLESKFYAMTNTIKKAP